MTTAHSKSRADIQVDDEGRIVIQSPELASQLKDFREADGSPLARSSVINVCPNLVPGCGREQ